MPQPLPQGVGVQAPVISYTCQLTYLLVTNGMTTKGSSYDFFLQTPNIERFYPPINCTSEVVIHILH